MKLHVETLWSSDDPMGLFEATLATVQNAVLSGVKPGQLPELCLQAAAISLALVSIDGAPVDVIWDCAESSHFESLGLSPAEGLAVTAAGLRRIGRDNDARAIDVAVVAADGHAPDTTGVGEGFTVLSHREEIADAMGALLKTEIEFVRLAPDALKSHWKTLAQAQ